MAGRVAEAALDDQSFEKVAQDALFRPLGMNRTTYAPTSARPFILVGGSLNSTLDDMAVFGQMHLNDGVYNGKRILSEASVTEMRRLQSPDRPQRTYGLGWFVGIYRGHLMAYHTGTIDGFYSAPSDGGGEESRLSVSWGLAGDRGNFRVTADYNLREELRRGERDYFTCGNQYIFDQSSGERADIIDPRTNQRWCEDLTWGHVWLYDYAEAGSGTSNVPNPFAGSLLSQFDYDNDLGQYTVLRSRLDGYFYR